MQIDLMVDDTKNMVGADEVAGWFRRNTASTFRTQVCQALHEKTGCSHPFYVSDFNLEYFITHIDNANYKIFYTIHEDEIVIDFDNRQEVIENVEWIKKSLKGTNTLRHISPDRLGGWLIIFGDKNTKDTDGNWFTKNTKRVDEIFKATQKLPWLYNHGMDQHIIKSTPLGVVDTLEKTDYGWWHEIQLQQMEMYKNLVQPYVKMGELGTSSGALPGNAKQAKSGEITEWTVVESTGTMTPADWRQVDLGTAKSYMKEAGIEFKDVFNRYMQEDQEELTQDDANQEPSVNETERLLAELDILEIEISL